MTKEYNNIIEKLYKFAFTLGLRSFSVNDLCSNLDISKPIFSKYFKNKTNLVEQLLKYDHQKFKSIFTDNNFEGLNAIKILLIVNKELSLRFKDFSPSLIYDLQKYYSELFQEAFEKDLKLVKEKIMINLNKGINQGMYRKEINQDLIVNLYMGRLTELHNPQNLPENYSVADIAEFIIDLLIRGIATPEGLAFYENEKKKLK